LQELDRQAKFAVGALVLRLRDEDPRVRRGVLDILRRIGVRRESYLAPIARAQKDADPWVRCWAAEDLVEMNAADRVAISRLIDDLQNPDDASCAAAALGLAGHFNPDVTPALIHVLQGKNRDVQSQATAILMQLGSRAREALPALVQARHDEIPGAENAYRVIHEAVLRENRQRHKH
jgi:HEAT repeat protein